MSKGSGGTRATNSRTAHGGADLPLGVKFNESSIQKAIAKATAHQDKVYKEYRAEDKKDPGFLYANSHKAKEWNEKLGKANDQISNLKDALWYIQEYSKYGKDGLKLAEENFKRHLASKKAQENIEKFHRINGTRR